MLQIYIFVYKDGQEANRIEVYIVSESEDQTTFQRNFIYNKNHWKDNCVSLRPQSATAVTKWRKQACVWYLDAILEVMLLPA